MATDLVSASLAPSTGPVRKRRRLGWDDPSIAPCVDAGRVHLRSSPRIMTVCPSPSAKQILQSCVVNTFQDSKCDQKVAVSPPQHSHRKKDSPPWLEDDKDGHYNFNPGDDLTSRYKILQKMGEGTFGRVLECWDRDAKELVAVKVIRSAEKYREAAMIEVDVLRILGKHDRTGSRVKAQEYFRHGKRLNWPDRSTTGESIRAVHRLPRLRDLLREHTEEYASSFVDLLECMLKYDPRDRPTAREALQHPFFQSLSQQR